MGTRYNPFGAVWQRVNWYAFYLRKERFYDVCHKATAVALLGTAGYLGVTAVYAWHNAVHQNWLHYVKKERTRKELMDLVRDAREKDLIPDAQTLARSYSY
eukprot:GHVT01041805.1.p1 GENE.GHVT01041805.1~~GHVT01041805.1.p1  ORF type:complete len:101 (+),score=7.09 GHVT01041805.1:477-779(+)